MSQRKHKVKLGARFSLFIVSYLPMFFIMCFRQIWKYSDYLNWHGFNKDGIYCFFKYFGAITFLIFVSIIGIIGLILYLKKINNKTEINGDVINISAIENKNSEILTYLFTYVIPFVYQDLSKVENVISIFTLLLVTFSIYVQSSLIVINPTISFWYSLYSIEYKENNNLIKGMILTKEKLLEEQDVIKIKKIGHKLFYAILKTKEKST